MSHNIYIEELTVMPIGEDYEKAYREALKAPSVLQAADKVWIGHLSAATNIKELSIILRSYFMHNTGPLYFMMAGATNE